MYIKHNIKNIDSEYFSLVFQHEALLHFKAKWKEYFRLHMLLLWGTCEDKNLNYICLLKTVYAS